MRILVLGANGQLGAPILRRLQQDYPLADVAGTMRAESMASESGTDPYFKTIIPFDPFRDDWGKLGKADALINCIGIIRETEELNFAKAHFGLTKLMLQHRAQMGEPKLIQVSALGADINSSSRFLSTKAQADLELLRHLNTVVVMPSIVCTQGTMLSRKLQLLNKLCRYTFGVLPFPAGTLLTRLQPVAIDDLAALVSALCSSNEHAKVIEIGGRERYTLRQLLDMLPKCKYVLPVTQAVFDLLFPVVSVLFPALLDKEQQVLLLQDNLADTGECERILGRSMASTFCFWRAELAGASLLTVLLTKCLIL